jgi:uncharacterized protein YjbJ (UPF0337 family)
MDDKTSGTVDKIKGKTNEVVGHIRGDKSQEMKGKVQQGMGEGKHALKDAKDAFTGDE